MSLSPQSPQLKGPRASWGWFGSDLAAYGLAKEPMVEPHSGMRQGNEEGKNDGEEGRDQGDLDGFQKSRQGPVQNRPIWGQELSNETGKVT